MPDSLRDAQTPVASASTWPKARSRGEQTRRGQQRGVRGRATTAPSDRPNSNLLGFGRCSCSTYVRLQEFRSTPTVLLNPRHDERLANSGGTLSLFICNFLYLCLKARRHTKGQSSVFGHCHSIRKPSRPLYPRIPGIDNTFEICHPYVIQLLYILNIRHHNLTEGATT